MKDRPTAEQLLQHPWILAVTKTHQNTIRRLNTIQELQDSVIKYNEIRSLKRNNSRASFELFGNRDGNTSGSNIVDIPINDDSNLNNASGNQSGTTGVSTSMYCNYIIV